MTVLAEPIMHINASPGPKRLMALPDQPEPLPRQVAVVVDAFCEVEPAAAAELGVMIMPRQVQADRRTVTLDAEHTLHHSCWATLPGRLAPAPYALGELAQAYDQLLRDGFHILALHLPHRLDSAVRVALAARSILLAKAYPTSTPRIAVYEVGAVGADFSFLVQAAAYGAAEGLGLRQLLTLLDRAQTLVSSLCLSAGAPVETMRATNGQRRLGSEQLWENDRTLGGLFTPRARGFQLSRQLFAAGGPLHAREPTTVHYTDQRLLGRISKAREQLGLPPLEAAPSLGLRQVFPRGCVALATLPARHDLDRVIDVIRRIERSAPASQRAGGR